MQCLNSGVVKKDTKNTLISKFPSWPIFGHFMMKLCFQQMENADAERDVYDELLTQAEIQGNINQVNGESHLAGCRFTE